MKEWCKIERGLLSPIFIMGFQRAFEYILREGFSDLPIYRDAGGVWVRIN